MVSRRATLGAGGASPAAEGISLPKSLSEAYEALATGNISWAQFSELSKKNMTGGARRRPAYTRRQLHQASSEAKRWKRRRSTRRRI
jgi:hypothetical protein